MGTEAKRLRSSVASSPARVRCAIYTRKSTDEGLDRDFNSLDAQRESGESYVNSLRNEGWTALAQRYDDGGCTGANMERPALKRLLADAEAGKLDCVVVYKLDRLTRAMKDFFKIMEVLDRHRVTFVSVTQQFNTTTSIGRLALNIVMSFAEFERETISERTRDKMHAARRKGKWIGGNLPLGYDVAPNGGVLIVNVAEADQVREVFRLYLELGSLMPVLQELDCRAWRMKQWMSRGGRQRGGADFGKNTLYNLLTNAIYTGRVKFQGKLYSGEHDRIIDDDTFNRVQEQLKRNGRSSERKPRNKGGALLKGIVRCGCGAGMTHTYVQKNQVRYRYYVCIKAHQQGWNKCETKSVSAPELEGAVLENIRRFAQRPAMLSGVLAQLEEMRRESSDMAMTEPVDVQDALLRFEPLWEQLNTSEQERLIRALVAEVKYDGPTGMVTVGFHSEAIKELCQE